MNYCDTVNANRMGDYLFKAEESIISSFLEKREVHNCLDIGCGTGRFSIPISKKGIAVTAMDINAQFLKKLKSKEGGKIIPVIMGDATNLPFRNSSFDCITSIQTVDNIEDIRKFYGACHELLKDGGYLIFDQTNKSSYKRCLQGVFSSHRTFYRYSYEEVLSDLREEGFRVEKCIGYNWVPFKRASNSILIPILEPLEAALRLSKHPSISPWVFFIAKKVEVKGN